MLYLPHFNFVCEVLGVDRTVFAVDESRPDKHRRSSLPGDVAYR